MPQPHLDPTCNSHWPYCRNHNSCKILEDSSTSEAVFDMLDWYHMLEDKQNAILTSKFLCGCLFLSCIFILFPKYTKIINQGEISYFSFETIQKTISIMKLDAPKFIGEDHCKLIIPEILIYFSKLYSTTTDTCFLVFSISKLALSPDLLYFVTHPVIHSLPNSQHGWGHSPHLPKYFSERAEQFLSHSWSMQPKQSAIIKICLDLKYPCLKHISHYAPTKTCWLI